MRSAQRRKGSKWGISLFPRLSKYNQNILKILIFCHVSYLLNFVLNDLNTILIIYNTTSIKKEFGF